MGSSEDTPPSQLSLLQMNRERDVGPGPAWSLFHGESSRDAWPLPFPAGVLSRAEGQRLRTASRRLGGAFSASAMPSGESRIQAGESGETCLRMLFFFFSLFLLFPFGPRHGRGSRWVKDGCSFGGSLRQKPDTRGYRGASEASGLQGLVVLEGEPGEFRCGPSS